MKICKKCLIKKELSNFRLVKKNKDGLSGTCKTCQYGHEPHTKECAEKICTHCKELKEIEKFSWINKSKTWKASMCKTCKTKMRKPNLEYIKRKQTTRYFSKLKERYSLTKEQYHQMLENQGNKCKICNNSSETKLHVDHCHTTNIVRGLLCNKCNQGLGSFKDNSQYLLQAIKYLQDTNTDKTTI